MKNNSFTKSHKKNKINVINNKLGNELDSKRSQITIFIIIAIVLVVGIGLFFLVRANIFSNEVPAEFKGAYDYYLSCIDADTYNGALILGQGAGYIEPVKFSPGSAFMPFSNELNFMGFGVPYWFYLSGNGLKKEQVPTRKSMEGELDNFLMKNIGKCDFGVLLDQGFEVVPGEVKSVETKISDNLISVKVNQDIVIRRGNTSWLGSNHNMEVKSQIGNLYDLAMKVYSYEKQDNFLEKYGIDVLRLYAPVDGTEISCSPKVWNAYSIRDELMNALEANVPEIKLKGDYYTLKNEDHKYFVRDIGADVNNVNANFIYSRYWPLRMNVWPSESGLMKADPVGLQEGLGMLGFCYVPYHFVYDLGYPVMIQLYNDDNEMFQFPIVVYIDKNNPINSTSQESAIANPVPELCKHKISNKTVSTYNTGLNPVESYISFKCFDTQCDIGKTKTNNGIASFTGGFPQCVNGFLIANAEGYETKKYLVSSLTEDNINIILAKKYKLGIELKTSGKNPDFGVITFTKDNQSISVAYPEQKTVELTEGQYEVKTYIYGSANINLDASSMKKCVQVPRAGVLGVFGFNEEKCFDMNIPSQTINQSVTGGGKQMQYITESELTLGKKIVINTEQFKTPTKPEDLQLNYNLIDNTGLDISIEK